MIIRVVVLAGTLAAAASTCITLPNTEPVPAPKAGPPGSVDIYIAAGKDQGAESCHFSQLSQSAATCEIWRLRYDTASRKVIDHEMVIGDGAHGWMPSVSPNGSQLVYAKYTGQGACIASARAIGGSNLGAGTELLCTGMGLPESWSYPVWRTDTSILVTHPVPVPMCVNTTGVCSPVERWGDTWEITLDASGRAKSAGPLIGEGKTAHISFEDPTVHPTDRSLVAGHGRFVTTGGSAPTCDDGKGTACASVKLTPTPFVADVDADKYWIYELRTTEAKYRQAGGAPLELAGCAHLSWSPDGDSLICTEQSTLSMDDSDLNRLYVFPVDPATDKAGQVNVRDVEPYFDHAPADSVVDLKSGESCEVFYHKYAEFCGAEDRVVASLVCDCDTPACTAGGAASKVVQAHVYVIEAADRQHPVYVDVTEQLEERLGKAPGSLHAFTSTCAPGTVGTSAKAAPASGRAPKPASPKAAAPKPPPAPTPDDPKPADGDRARPPKP